MTVMLAPAKLTLSLHITGVRADGYHLLDAEMVTVDLGDELEFAHGDAFDVRGADAPTGADNLVLRALRLVDRRAHITLTKNIPVGAGLGGGSADAACVLRWADRAEPELAVALGADVLFCLRGGRARVSGIGEIVEPLPDAPGMFTLLTPPVTVSTPAVYAAWDELGSPTGPGANDLEAAALHVEPSLSAWRDALGDATGVEPALAGSGGTWFVAGAHDDVEINGVRAVVVKTTGPLA